MSLNSAQFEALFTNAFGSGTESFDIVIDASGDDAIGRKGSHTVELHVVQQRAIEWRVDGASFLPWKQHAKDDDKRFENAVDLRLKLA
jgi:hypothetical protein